MTRPVEIHVNKDLAEQIRTAMSRMKEIGESVARMRKNLEDRPFMRRAMDSLSMQVIGAREMETAQAHLASEVDRVREELGLPTHRYLPGYYGCLVVRCDAPANTHP